jgi:hypothetical protein
MNRQRGQALAAVLVVMTLILLLAGGVAVATSALDARYGLPSDDTSVDLAAQSTVSATVARLKSGQASCNAVGVATMPAATVTSSPTFQVSLPTVSSPVGSTTVNSFCTSLATVADSVSLPVQWQGSCGTVRLTNAVASDPFGIWWALFNARSRAGAGYAFIGGGPIFGQPVCPRSPPPLCSHAVPAAAVVQVVIGCQFVLGVFNPTLYIFSPSAQPARVFLLDPKSVTGTGTTYLAAAGTGLPAAGRDYEDLLFHVHSEGNVSMFSEQPL